MNPEVFSLLYNMSPTNNRQMSIIGASEPFMPTTTNTTEETTVGNSVQVGWSSLTEATKYSSMPTGAFDPNAKTISGSGLKQAKMPDPIYAEDPMQTLSANNMLPESGMSAKQVVANVNGAVDILRAGSYFSNAISSYYSGKMKASAHNFSSRQYTAAADVLERNMKDVSRAARLDANRYKIQGAETKAKQKTSMAATGFAVGKGSFGATLNTTDARTNYNVALTILKSELQNAELVRKAGAMRAQAEIEKGNASIAKKQGKADMWQGILNGTASLLSAAGNFYIGTGKI